MSMFDNLKKQAADLSSKATDAIKSHEGQIKDGIGKAGDFIDDKTGKRFSEQIDSVQDKANSAVDKAGGTAEKTEDKAHDAAEDAQKQQSEPTTEKPSSPSNPTPGPTGDGAQTDATNIDPDLGR